MFRQRDFFRFLIVPDERPEENVGVVSLVLIQRRVQCLLSICRERPEEKLFGMD